MKLLFLYLFVFSLRNTNTKKINKNIKLPNYKQSLSLYIKETNHSKKYKYISLTCLKNDDISEKDKKYNNLSIKNHEITNNKSSNIFIITILLFYFIGVAYNNSKK